jgi:ubiquitin-like protein Nedd8
LIYNRQKIEILLIKYLINNSLMLINVKNLSGKTINIDVPETASVYNIKEMIQELEGIGPNHQRLLFGGKLLEDSKKIEETNIKTGNTLRMVLALRGGA